MNSKCKTKGISLIVLVITIIVIVILAGAVILSLSQNNPLNSANESVFKSDLKAFESDLSMYLTEKYVSTVGSYNPESLKADDLTAEYNGVIIAGATIKNIIPILATTDKYNGQLEIVNGRLVYKGTDIPKKRWAEEINLEVVNGDRLNAIISTAIGLPISAGTNAVCTIKISSNSSIDNIDLTGNLQLLDANSVPVVPQPVFTIAAPTGNDTDTLRNVDITINTTTLVEGSYKLKLKARCISNIYGITNESDVETGILFEIDNTPPVNPVVSASPSAWTNGNVTVTFSYPLGDILKEYSLNASTWSGYTSPIVVSTNNTTIYARAIDTAGNQSGQTTITIANIDKISPTVAFATNGGTNLKLASTIVTASDLGGSNINASTLQYVWDTQNTTTPVSGWAVFTNATTITKSASTGTYYLWIKGSDNAGNSITTKSNAFVTDNIVPIITLSQSTVTIYQGSSYIDTGVSASDNINGNITSNIVITGSVNTSAFGSYILTYNVSDSSGNAAAVKTRTVNVLQTIYAYDYTSNYQTFTASYTGNYQVELWGAQGGGVTDLPGKGGYTKGDIYLTTGQILYVYVGNSGYAPLNSISFNGGGVPDYTYHTIYGGGGAADIRLTAGNWNDFNSLKSRIMVAAGGGGGEDGFSQGYGGAAGGLNGGNSLNSVNVTVIGATQTSGYGFGIGQDSGVQGIDGGYDTGGGGGGYYGGYRGANSNSGGSGASSFISGYAGCNAISSSSTQGNIIHTNQANHYSGFVFTNSVMKSGAESMPNPLGVTVTGKTGNGYARITYKY